MNGLAAGSDVIALTAGGYHTCALKSDGAVLCWGSNSGQLGDNSTTQRLVPTAVNGLGAGSGVIALAAGGYHTCALKSDGAVLCWGDNGIGQLGDNSNTQRLVPTAVSGLGAGSGVTALVTGWQHTCALKSDGAVLCWGNNNYGQLGDNSTTWRQVPTAVSGLAAGSGVIALTAGNFHTCALKNNGVVQCWGRNEFGELGDTTTSWHSVPTAVYGLGVNSGVTALIARGEHTCALKNDDAVLCWGYNVEGQLGDNSTVQRLIPTAVNGLGAGSGTTALTVGSNHTCALKSGGAVLCWGRNVEGQLGDNSTTQHLVPTSVNGLGAGSGVTRLVAGGAHTCALENDGAVLCWGNNANGQLGNGEGSYRPYPGSVLGSPFIDLTLTGVTAPANATYRLGQTLGFTAQYSAIVTVTGTPRLVLDIGGSPRYAMYTSGSGSTALGFAYTVAADDSDTGGISLSSPIDLNGGTIQGADGAAPLAFTPPDTSAVRVDGVVPTVLSITRVNVSPTVAGSVDFLVHFSEDMGTVLTGDFALTESGAVTGAAITGLAGSGSDWTFTASTGSGSGTLRLDAVGGGSTDLAGNEFTAGFSSGESYALDRSTATAIGMHTPAPSLPGAPVTVSWTVTPTVAGTPTGDVTVTADSGETCSAAVGDGNCALAIADAGTHTLTASYGGDAAYDASTSAGVAHTVDAFATTLALGTITPEPSLVGDTASVPWTLSSSGGTASGGNVTVTASTGETCTVSATDGACGIVFNSLGARTLTASYSGGGNFAASVTAAGVNHTVQGATVVVITADTPDPSLAGASYTVSGAVTSASGTPTGSVTVSDGGSTSAPCALASGAFSCTLTTASLGTHNLVASYSGDGDFAASVSVAATHAVTDGLAVAIGDDRSYVQYGHALTYIIGVSNAAPATATVRVRDVLPVELDATGATWTCLAHLNDATCTASGSGDLDDTVTIPQSGSLIYLLTVLVKDDPGLPGDVVENTVTANAGAGDVSASDSTQVVIFRNGLESGGDGAQ